MRTPTPKLLQPRHETARASGASSAAYGRGVLIVVLTAGTLGLAACGSSGSSSAAGDSPSISIVEPKDGATVTEPFTVKVASSEQLGATDTGMDHYHLTFDGNSQDYTVETKPEATVNTLSPGQHTIKVSLQHADHSPVGPAAEVTVTVAGAGGTPTSGGGNGY